MASMLWFWSHLCFYFGEFKGLLQLSGFVAGTSECSVLVDSGQHSKPQKLNALTKSKWVKSKWVMSKLSSSRGGREYHRSWKDGRPLELQRILDLERVLSRYFTVENNSLVLERPEKKREVRVTRKSISLYLVLDYSWVLMQLGAVVEC